MCACLSCWCWNDCIPEPILGTYFFACCLNTCFQVCVICILNIDWVREDSASLLGGILSCAAIEQSWMIVKYHTHQGQNHCCHFPVQLAVSLSFISFLYNDAYLDVVPFSSSWSLIIMIANKLLGNLVDGCNELTALGGLWKPQGSWNNLLLTCCPAWWCLICGENRCFWHLGVLIWCEYGEFVAGCLIRDLLWYYGANCSAVTDWIIRNFWRQSY